ncbi:hypothetical protein [Psychrobacter sp. JCM 18903]|uniref:hypothetical protein n=1 Tax=Psychrobacter sp. JCM 18903 TaxID=1298610 RepID=UPI0004B3C983|nr:hypothetical protein [Psychrobacter sp. JCM 18903]
MKVSFYVLTENKAQDFLGFICQLTQTALNKSSQSLLILIEKNDELLSTLDEAFGHKTIRALYRINAF